MRWNEGLTGRALNIASSTSALLRVMAGPGTGKSFALKRRLMRLLEDGVPPHLILVVTFTRMASADLIRESTILKSMGAKTSSRRLFTPTVSDS